MNFIRNKFINYLIILTVSIVSANFVNHFYSIVIENNQIVTNKINTIIIFIVFGIVFVKKLFHYFINGLNIKLEDKYIFVILLLLSSLFFVELLHSKSNFGHFYNVFNFIIVSLLVIYFQSKNSRLLTGSFISLNLIILAVFISNFSIFDFGNIYFKDNIIGSIELNRDSNFNFCTKSNWVGSNSFAINLAFSSLFFGSHFIYPIVYLLLFLLKSRLSIFIYFLLLLVNFLNKKNYKSLLIYFFIPIILIVFSTNFLSRQSVYDEYIFNNFSIPYCKSHFANNEKINSELNLRSDGIRNFTVNFNDLSLVNVLFGKGRHSYVDFYQNKLKLTYRNDFIIAEEEKYYTSHNFFIENFFHFGIYGNFVFIFMLFLLFKLSNLKQKSCAFIDLFISFIFLLLFIFKGSLHTFYPIIFLLRYILLVRINK